VECITPAADFSAGRDFGIHCVGNDVDTRACHDAVEETYIYLYREQIPGLASMNL